MGKKVKNYKEYVKNLKDAFGDYAVMPAIRDIKAFIERYDLYNDWRIESSDVQKDIRTLIINSNKRKKKRISSYKNYLEKLRDTFGIPKTMPDLSCIVAFIDEYRLSREWGITKNDVTKDLQAFIDGKYDEMTNDATPVHKSVPVMSKPRQHITSTGNCRPVYSSYNYSSYTYNPAEKTYSTLAKRSERLSKTEVSNTKKPSRKKPSIKTKSEKEKTIFIDGDNHLPEGQKGIEQLPKSTKVRAVFSQAGAKRKFDEKYGNRPNVSSKLVKPGNQAVDNQIKAEAGQLLKKRNQDITVVSHDKGYEKYGDKKNGGRDGNRFSVAKSVKDKNPKRRNGTCKKTGVTPRKRK